MPEIAQSTPEAGNTANRNVLQSLLEKFTKRRKNTEPQPSSPNRDRRRLLLAGGSATILYAVGVAAAGRFLEAPENPKPIPTATVEPTIEPMPDNIDAPVAPDRRPYLPSPVVKPGVYKENPALGDPRPPLSNEQLQDGGKYSPNTGDPTVYYEE